MSSEFHLQDRLLLAAVSGLIANGKCPDDEVADRAIKIVNSVVDKYLGGDADSGD